MSIDLKQHGDQLLEIAKEEHCQDGQAGCRLVIVCRHMRGEEDGVALMPIRGGDLGAHEFAIRESVRRFRGYAFLLVAEMWVKITDIPEKGRYRHVRDFPEPRTAPGRGEALQILAVTHQSTSLRLSHIRRIPFGSTFDDQPWLQSTSAVQDGTSAWLRSLLEAP